MQKCRIIKVTILLKIKALTHQHLALKIRYFFSPLYSADCSAFFFKHSGTLYGLCSLAVTKIFLLAHFKLRDKIWNSPTNSIAHTESEWSCFSNHVDTNVLIVTEMEKNTSFGFSCIHNTLLTWPCHNNNLVWSLLTKKT